MSKKTFVISVLNQKGGVGKTTTSFTLARAFQLMGYEVALIDSDPQGSSRDWNAKKESPVPVLSIDRPTIDKDIGVVTADIVIIDGAPRLEQMATSAIKASDLVIVPIQPSLLDVWATVDLLDMIKARIEITDGKLQAICMVSRKIANTKIGAEFSDVLSGFGLGVLDTEITNYVDYPEAIVNGQTVHDYDRNGKASKEAWQLAEEIMAKYINPTQTA